MKVLKALIILAFLASIPWAINYNLNFDKYGSLDNPAEPVFIQVCTLNTPNFRQQAAEYSQKNPNVKIFTIALSAELIDTIQCDIKIIRDGETLRAFIYSSQPHCKKFLDYIQIEY